MTFRLLTAREIDCRIQMIKPSGVSLLLYKDARCDMSILDETFGPMNWQRRHDRDNANCIVSVWDPEKGQWIAKEDTGTESNTEKEKGLASDSFKRACVCWGIGRELYTAPFIWIPADKCRIEGTRCNDRFEVSEISYNDHREISRLVIVNAKTKTVVYTFGGKPAAAPAPAPEPKPEEPVVTCSNCGKPVVDYGKKTKWEILEYTKQRFGIPYCGKCLSQFQKAEKAKEEGK